MGVCVCERSRGDNCHAKAYLVSSHCYIPSSVAVNYLKTELTYLSSQIPGVSIHQSTIIARVMSAFSMPVAPVAQRYHVTSDTLGREFDPGKRDFSH